MMGDEHPIDQQLDDPPAAGKIEAFQACAETGTQHLDLRAELCQAHPVLLLRVQLPLLLYQRLDAILQCRAAHLEFVEGDHFGRERIHQPFALSLRSATCLLEVLEPRIPVVLHQFPSPRPTEGLGHHRWATE